MHYNILNHSIMFQIILEYSRLFQNILDQSRIFSISLEYSRLVQNILDYSRIFYVIFARFTHIATHFAYNSISGQTPFNYFRFVVSILFYGPHTYHFLRSCSLVVVLIFWLRSSSFFGDVVFNLVEVVFICTPEHPSSSTSINSVT